MVFRMLTIDKMIAAMHEAIEDAKEGGGDADHVSALVEVAKLLKKQKPSARPAALAALERRLARAKASRTALGYDRDHMIGVAEELMGHWYVVRSALEMKPETERQREFDVVCGVVVSDIGRIPPSPISDEDAAS